MKNDYLSPSIEVYCVCCEAGIAVSGGDNANSNVGMGYGSDDEFA